MQVNRCTIREKKLAEIVGIFVRPFYGETCIASMLLLGCFFFVSISIFLVGIFQIPDCDHSQ